MEKKRFFNFKNLFLISFLAVAGIFSAGAFVVNKQVQEAANVERADADGYSNSVFYFTNRTGWGNNGVYCYSYGGSGGKAWRGDLFSATSYSYSSNTILSCTVTGSGHTTFIINKDGQSQWGDIQYRTDGSNFLYAENKWMYWNGSVNPSGTRTIYYLNTNDWADANVKCYGWNHDYEYSGWPGTKMTKTSTKVDNHYVYKITINNMCESFIFSNNGDSQTSEFKCDLGSANVYCDGSGFTLPLAAATMKYSFDNSTFTAMSSEAKDGCVRNFYSSSISQNSGDMLYLQYVDINGTTQTVSTSAMGLVGGEGANNFKMVSGRPTIRYSNVTGNIDVRAVNNSGTVTFYAWAKGINDSNNDGFDIIKNGTQLLGCNYKANSGGNTREWYVENVTLSQNDIITFLDEHTNPGDNYGVEYDVASLNEAANGFAITSGHAKAQYTGKYDLYVQYGSSGFDKLYSNRKTRIVTYDMKGHGSQIDPNYYVNTGSKISAPTAPTETGYTFVGWYKDTTCTNAWNFATDTVTDDTILYAKWSAKTSKLSFDLNYGSGTAPGWLVATYGAEMPNYPDSYSVPTRYGYNFDGYYDEYTELVGGTGTKYYNADRSSARNWDKDTTEGTTLYAGWTAKTTTVTLDNGTGSTNTVTATFDEFLPDVTVPTRTGYTFQGYWSDGAAPQQFINSSGKGVKYWGSDAATATLYARWGAEKYEVTISAGTGVSGVYLSTDPNATSGSASGTKFDYDSTVYGFVVLQGGYAHNESDWDEYELISGSADTADAIYRIGSLTVSTSGNAFGTINALSGAEGAELFWDLFNEYLDGVCKDDGSTVPTELLNKWNIDIVDNYDSLEGYEKYWLTNREAASSIGISFDRYDYILGKYEYTQDPEELDYLYDFLGRTPATSSAIRSFTPFDLLNGDDDNNITTVVVIVSSAVALLSITALSMLIVKKRKRK